MNDNGTTLSVADLHRRTLVAKLREDEARSDAITKQIKASATMLEADIAASLAADRESVKAQREAAAARALYLAALNREAA